MGQSSSGMLILLVIVCLYFLPTIIAMGRGHRNALAIVLLNVLGGWTGLGWLGALIWSVLRDGAPASPASTTADRDGGSGAS